MSRLRLQADADIDEDIVRGLRRIQPAIDILTAVEGGLIGLRDPEVLQLSAEGNRILITHDMRTMPGHFKDRLLQGLESPGVFGIPQSLGIGRAIDEVYMVWRASEHEEWRNLFLRLPL